MKECNDCEQLQIAIYIMDEYVRGSDSEVYNYLQTLPTDLEFFYYWDPSLLSETQDEEVLKLSDGMRLEVEKQWTEMEKFL